MAYRHRAAFVLALGSAVLFVGGVACTSEPAPDSEPASDPEPIVLSKMTEERINYTGLDMGRYIVVYRMGESEQRWVSRSPARFADEKERLCYYEARAGALLPESCKELLRLRGASGTD